MKKPISRLLQVLGVAALCHGAPAAEGFDSALPPSHSAVYRTPLDNTTATALVSRLETDGFAPVWTVDDPGGKVVHVGRCPTFADAELLTRSLRRKGYTRFWASEVTFTAPTASQFNLAGAPLVLCPNGETPCATGTVTPTASMLALEASLQSDPDDAAVLAARTLIDSLPDNDPAKAWAIVRMGRAMVRHEKTAAAVQPLFLNVAHGVVTATDQDRLEARWLAADSIHYYSSDFLSAYQAYQEILQLHGPDDTGVKARVLVEMTGCLLALARAGRAEYSDVRDLASHLQSTIPSTYKRAHAVADLIACESYLYEGRHAEALTAFNGFETRHPGRIRETCMAYHMRGFLHGRLGDWTNCLASYNALLAIVSSDPVEDFYWAGERYDMRRFATQWLRVYAVQFKDQEIVAQCDTELALMDANPLSEPNPAVLDMAFPHGFYEVPEQ